MRRVAVILLIMCIGAAFTALVFAALIIVVRLKPGIGKLFPFLDPERLKRSHRGWLWSFIPLGTALAAGVVLLIIHNSPLMFLGGLLLICIPAAGVLGVLFLGQLARSVSQAGGNK
ncbi:hypothetical protein GF359_07215 [candidate division WOR-3 bacterium]|uniref:Uncharacterized protein n=1 Tax=candidate division WOR-3 bacterium TaxID=2052148 RepID=A0A9D5KA65_UNCW3|nr:hypothetical protein [candidate division WOR-3 bacterium]MBD3364989.1 hypothetical protein [candidate division WOR-3 bacterium]